MLVTENSAIFVFYHNVQIQTSVSDNIKRALNS